MNRRQTADLLDRLEELYPQARCALCYRNPWELLVATILSAQCTDDRVNRVTPALFAAFPGPEAMARAGQDEVEALIRSTGFFRNKARNLIARARVIVEEYGGEVPARLDELVRLPGVGRKTANVVLGNAFGIPGMVVDTHVKRLSRRFGWTKSQDPDRIEKDLCRLFPADRWVQTGHILITHGRAVCKAPMPLCGACPVSDLCPRLGVVKSR
ncbi:DNA-(apurinic or apyrimidinic site) lyase /endonuclease III [Geothermobacter ehrlichii]|uniref:Endonuclease III n=1 Tax=Geothermobacter ehrlichii TaxID=213224 RepID=A0A5D3WGT2_9BACT|nr:endonuclease III [Geothermobacter ehrlichii]TYO97678.1 DNA-(apurinic or apyrimidinic site) lyase /endonuclease III [Geothermobacter ehrlichii]